MGFPETVLGVGLIAIGCASAALFLAIRRSAFKNDKPVYDVNAPVLDPEPTPTIFRAGIRLGPRAYVSNDGQSWVTATVISVDGDTEAYDDSQTVTYVIDGPALPEDNQELKPITEPVSEFLSKFMLVGTARHDRSFL